MFKRHIEMKVVKESKQHPGFPEPRRPRMTPTEISALVYVNAKSIGILAGTGYAAKKLLDTSSEVALIIAKTKIK